MATITAGTKRLPLDSIVWREPSRPIDPRHVKELAASIEEVGLLQPIGVVDLGGEKYEGRLGRHRFEAVKALRQKEIDVNVLDLDGVKQRIATAHENLKRKDLNPMEEARYFKIILDARRAQDSAITQEAVGKELQVTQGDFSNALARLELEPHVQKLLEDGRIMPGHVEHVLGPLVSGLKDLGTQPNVVNEIVNEFAHKIAAVPEKSKEALDIRTAKKDVDRLLGELRTKVLGQEAIAAAKKAGGKVFSCPQRDYGSPRPTKFFEDKGRPVLEHKPDWGGAHRWYADTGERYLTAQERKEDERVEAQRAKQRRMDVRERAKEKERKVDRVPSVWYSRATMKQWLVANQRTALEAGVREIRLLPFVAGLTMVRGKVRLPASDHAGAPDGYFDPDTDEVYLSAVDMPDGNGGRFPTRVQIGMRSAGTQGVDHMAEDDDAKEVRKRREELLAYQAKEVGVKQAADDLFPAELKGFRLGDAVRVPGSIARATILAFDLESECTDAAEIDPDVDVSVELGKTVVVLLDTSRPRKLWILSAVQKLLEDCPTCGEKIRVAQPSEKPGLYCLGCEKPVAGCECAPPKGKKTGRPRKMQSASRDGGPPPLAGSAEKRKAKKTLKGRDK